MAEAKTNEGERNANGSSKWVEVRDSKIHQRGLFAQRDIPEGTRFIEYFGEKITHVESKRRALLQYERGRARGDGTIYIFSLNTRYDIDGDVPGNDAKFVNHSCDPNSVADVNDNAIWLIALRDITKGEEILYDYNLDASLYEYYPCRCGAENCLGYIVGQEFRPELMKMLEARKKKKKKGKSNKKEKKKGLAEG